MSTNRNLLDLIKILLKWRKLVIVVTLLAAAGSVVVSLLLPNYYKSTTTFYPQNLSAFDRGYLFGTESKEKVQSLFGDKQDVNRVLSIAKSTELIGHIIDHYNLADHYGIDTTGSMWRYKVQKEFDENFKVIKSDLDNIELSIWDTDANLAAEIANYFVFKINQIYSGLLEERNAKNEESVTQQLIDLEKELKAISDSMATVRDTSSISYQVLAGIQANLLEDYNNWKSLSTQYKAASGYQVNSLFIIEKAYAAEKKDRPVRWLIVVSATLAAFFLSILGAIFIEKYHTIREELVHE